MKKVGVIGVGVVGKAVYDGLKQNGQLHVIGYDKFRKEYPMTDDLFTCPVIFVCVPTATNYETKEQDLSPLRETLQLLKDRNFEGAICVKSTVVPGTTAKLAQEYGLDRVCHNPEFLTAAKPFEDFMNQVVIHVGGRFQDTAAVRDTYMAAGFKEEIIKRFERSTQTELIKYYHNLFLSVKVAFANEMYEVCQRLNEDYDFVREGTIQAGGLGAGHTRVPGPDGKLGYSGMCFPKDTVAFCKFAQDNGLKMEVLEATINKNNRLRPGNEKGE